MEKKPYFKCIILVLASDDTPYYRTFKKIWESYMFRDSNIKVFFTYGAGISFEPKEYDLYYPDLKETVTPPWTTRKVIRAMEHIDNNYDYTFLVRTNLSTFWYFRGLLKRLSALPTSRCFSGNLSIFPIERSGKHVVGTGMIMSRDIAREIIRQQNLINIPHSKYVAEDKMLSDFVVHTLGIDIIYNNNPHTPNFVRFEQIKYFNELEILRILASPNSRYIDHFRIKNMHNRNIDIQLMKYLKDFFYPNTMAFDQKLYYRKHKLYGPPI